MVRNFPRTPRRRVVAALAASSLVLSFAALPLASADDLRDRRNRVEGDISHTLESLDQSSAQLQAATQALSAAQADLARAEGRLAETRGELAVAVVMDRRMQKELEVAVRRLADARRELAQGQADIAAQEEFVGQIAVQNYQQGDPNLMGLSMVLSSQDPAELTGQLNSVQNVMEKEARTLAHLDAARVLLAVKEEEVEAAKEEVARQRRAAAENLERKKELEAQAEEAQREVAHLVAVRAAAQNAAASARRADLEMLRGLQQERDRISDVLAARAEAARRRAEAEAAAAARNASGAASARAAAAAASRGSGGFLDHPVDGYLTSVYGMRLHPVYKRWTLHDGTDFGASCGMPIRAAADGRVIDVYFNAGYGNRVIIDNGYQRNVGLGTAYNHLSSFATYPGDSVERGEVIGYVGNTGYSTGCHLHFMVFENGVAVDPMGWL